MDSNAVFSTDNYPFSNINDNTDFGLELFCFVTFVIVKAKFLFILGGYIKYILTLKAEARGLCSVIYLTECFVICNRQANIIIDKGLLEVNLVVVLIKNTNIKSEGLKLLNKNLKDSGIPAQGTF